MSIYQSDADDLHSSCRSSDNSVELSEPNALEVRKPINRVFAIVKRRRLLLLRHVGTVVLVILATTVAAAEMQPGVKAWQVAASLPGIVAAISAALWLWPSKRDWQRTRTELQELLDGLHAWRTPDEELERALRHNDPDMARRVLEAGGPTVDRYRGSYAPSLLFSAVAEALATQHRTRVSSSRACNLAAALLDHGASVSRFRDRDGDTVLDRAEKALAAGCVVPAGLLFQLRAHAEKEELMQTARRKREIADTDDE